MKARVLLWIGTAGVLAATLGLEASQSAGRHRLEAERARLVQIRSERSHLELENAHLKEQMGELGSIAALRDKVRQLAKLRAYYDGLQLEERRLKATLKLPDGAVWPDYAVVRRAADWTYVGQATPEAAMESVLAVAHAGDVERLATLIGFEETAKAKAQALFDQLPAASQAEYGTPEKVMATLIAGQMPADYAAMAVIGTTNPNPDAALVKLRLEAGGGAQSDLDFKLERSNGAWRLDVPAQVVAALGQRLTGAVEAAH